MKSLVLGASPNPERYSFRATTNLSLAGHEVIPVGLRQGEIAGITIQTGLPQVEDVDTVTLYLGPKNQPPIKDYVLGLKPRRVIFNPGTENTDFMNLLRENGVEVILACTLVMLSVGNY